LCAAKPDFNKTALRDPGALSGVDAIPGHALNRMLHAQKTLNHNDNSYLVKTVTHNPTHLDPSFNLR
jgi:hypothetical protein